MKNTNIKLVKFLTGVVSVLVVIILLTINLNTEATDKKPSTEVDIQVTTTETTEIEITTTSTTEEPTGVVVKVTIVPTTESETIEKTSDVDEPSQPEEIPTCRNITLSETDLYYLQQAVEIEAEAEGYEGKVAVANAILNRVESSDFAGNNVVSIITAPSQFECYFGGKWGSKEITPETIQAIEDTLNGYNNVGNATYFCNPNWCDSSWFENNLEYVDDINNHRFYSIPNK